MFYLCLQNHIDLFHLMKISFGCQYVQKDNVKNANRKDSKDKSAFTVVPRREDHSSESSIKGVYEIDSCKSSFLPLDFVRSAFSCEYLWCGIVIQFCIGVLYSTFTLYMPSSLSSFFPLSKA